MMPEERFWKIIDDTRSQAKAVPLKKGEDFSQIHERFLREALRRLKPVEIAAFVAREREFYTRAYRWDLWAAAYWMHGGCSDDSFMDFRHCLVSLGREWYTRILADPDVLAETVGRKDIPYLVMEWFQYIAGDIYKELTGKEQVPESDPPFRHPEHPAGERFDFDDEEEMGKRLPKLVAKLPDMGE